MTIDFETPKRVKRERRPRGRRPPEREELRWWAQPPETMHESIAAATRRIADRLSDVRDRQVINRLMYEEIDWYRRYGAGPDVSAAERHGRITMNVVQAATDNIASTIVRNRPRALFLTSGGDHKTRKRARLLTKVVHAIMKDAGCYDAAEDVFTDAAVEKLGTWHLYVDGGEIRCVSVPPNEILVDQSEGRRRLPTQFHRQKPVPRDELLHAYPEHSMEIENATPCEGMAVDMVHVIESWHLESGDGAKDGRYAVTIDGATLHEEEWNKDYYPFVNYRWYRAGHGWWGRAIPDEIGSMQRMINSLLTSLNTGAALAASLKYFVRKEAQVNKQHLASNEFGAVVEYLGDQPPMPVTPNPMPDWLVGVIWELAKQAHGTVGSSFSQSTGTKPPGVESARAIREASDLASGRLQVPAQRFESCYVELAHIIVDMAKDLYGGSSDVEILVQEKMDGIKPVKWRDVDMDRDQYKIMVFPVSSLPVSPSGRLAQVQELMQAGFLSFDAAVELLEFPDLESEVSRLTATRRIVESVIEYIKDESAYPVRLHPLPQWNLGLAAELANEAITVAQSQQCDDQVLMLLGIFAEDCQELLAPQKMQEQQMHVQAQQVAQQAAAPQMMPPGPPPGPPQ